MLCCSTTSLLVEKDPEVVGAAMYPSNNTVQNAVNFKDHTTLVAVVKAAGLVDALEGPRPCTVFALGDPATFRVSAGRRGR
jgi:uncharacterized surface protein with fasciclin (FAS1) repeats